MIPKIHLHERKKVYFFLRETLHNVFFMEEKVLMGHTKIRQMSHKLVSKYLIFDTLRHHVLEWVPHYFHHLFSSDPSEDKAKWKMKKKRHCYGISCPDTDTLRIFFYSRTSLLKQLKRQSPPGKKCFNVNVINANLGWVHNWSNGRHKLQSTYKHQ